MNVINRRKDLHIETVYIGRGSRWGNPYSIGADGDREMVMQLYAYELWRQLRTGETTPQDLIDLQNETLGCYCKPAFCHGDIIKAASDWLIHNELDTNLFQYVLCLCIPHQQCGHEVEW